MKKRDLLLTILLIAQQLWAQSNITMDNIREAYQNFDYTRVVSLSNYLVENPDSLSESDRIEIFTMMGVSNYSLNVIEESRINFIEILKIDKEFELNPTLISPKIIGFFNNIKKDYKQITVDIPPVPKDSVTIAENKFSLESYTRGINMQNNSFVRSLFFPGWGQIYAGETTKGWIMLVGSTGLLGSVIYTVVETNKREELYMNETNADLIPERYSSYNDMYKMRNLLIGAYAALWLYSQIDILLFGDNLPDDILSLQKQNNGHHPNIALSLKLLF